MSEPLLRASDLCVTFPARAGRVPVRAVDHVSFEIAPGQTLGLVGESGSGKTTTARAVLQLEKPSRGSVRLLGRELVGMPRAALRAMRRHMQFVLQNPYSSLHPRMTVAQILAEPLVIHRTVGRRRIPERVAELMLLVGLDPLAARRYPHQFSGGQRQRIAIARALAVNPDLVVCDEPVSALDVRTQAQIVDLLLSLQQDLGLSYLFIAHDLAIVRAVAHRVAVMYGGRIVEEGQSADVYGQPTHPYTRTLIDAVPIADPARQRAKLAEAAPEMHFGSHGQADEVAPCVFGEDHAATGTRAWHELAPTHGVSCRYWPMRATSAGS